MWFLLTDRKLKGYRLFGPFQEASQADELARKLYADNRIKGWSVVIAEVPPKYEADGIHYTAQL